MTPTRSQLIAQLTRLRNSALFSLLQAAAAAHGLELAFVLAIGSRETNLVNRLGDWRPASSGHPSEYRGVGILQIDIQHEIARVARDSGSWRTHPAPLIDFGAAILSANRYVARAHFPTLTDAQQQKIAAAGYNAGLQRALDAAGLGSVDAVTTGADYGKDVLARSAIFAELFRKEGSAGSNAP